jgi:hypothetical protein
VNEPKATPKAMTVADLLAVLQHRDPTALVVISDLICFCDDAPPVVAAQVVVAARPGFVCDAAPDFIRCDLTFDTEPHNTPASRVRSNMGSRPAVWLMGHNDEAPVRKIEGMLSPESLPGPGTPPKEKAAPEGGLSEGGNAPEGSSNNATSTRKLFRPEPSSSARRAD